MGGWVRGSGLAPGLGGDWALGLGFGLAAGWGCGVAVGLGCRSVPHTRAHSHVRLVDDGLATIARAWLWRRRRMPVLIGPCLDTCTPP